MNIFQLPSGLRVSGLALNFGVRAYRSSFFLLDFSPMSPSEVGLQSRSASTLTRGANDSIASLLVFIR